MPNTNPPDKVDNGKSPGHRHVDTPDADTNGQQIGYGQQQDHNHQKGHCKANQPAPWRTAAEGDGADFIGDRGVRVASPADRGRWLALHVWSAGILRHDSILTLLAWCV